MKTTTFQLKIVGQPRISFTCPTATWKKDVRAEATRLLAQNPGASDVVAIVLGSVVAAHYTR